MGSRGELFASVTKPAKENGLHYIDIQIDS